MSRHQIDYESLAQDAMRGLVRTVMQRIAKSGLPGEHHFYISFYTRGHGVTISKRLLERYPDEMTIVLQNKFSDLKAYDERFEVTLWFDSIAERLAIPYAAIKVFFDPSVPFGHQFEVAESAAAHTPHGPVLIDKDATDRAPADRHTDARPSPVTPVTATTNSRPKPASSGSSSKVPAKSEPTKAPLRGPTAVPNAPAATPPSVAGARVSTGNVHTDSTKPGAPKPATARPVSDRPSEKGDKPVPAPAPASEAPGTEEKQAEKPEDGASPAAAKVVALDAFRKKS